MIKLKGLLRFRFELNIKLINFTRQNSTNKGIMKEVTIIIAKASIKLLNVFSAFSFIELDIFEMFSFIELDKLEKFDLILDNNPVSSFYIKVSS